MRLICPNCSAQYEIDVTLIPDEGRDVQCSNCGHTWFELPPPADLHAAPREDAPEPETYDDPQPEESAFDDEGDFDDTREEPSQAAKAIAAATEDVSEDMAEHPRKARSESEPFKDVEDPFEAAASEFQPNTEPDDQSKDQDREEDEDDTPDTGAIVPTKMKARRPSDAADVDLLREEAERELSRRRAPPSESLETQTDFGLDSISTRKTPSRALRARMARSSGDSNLDTSDTTSEADYKAPQRDLLPDIDEINSTLNQNQTRGDPKVAAARRSGFRLGFGLILLLAVLCIIAYAFAPQIAQALPGAERALLRFVDLANQLRDWIDGLLA